MEGVREQDEDAAWRSIVDNYGERATLDEDVGAAVDVSAGDDESEVVEPDLPEVDHLDPNLDEQPDETPYSPVLDAPEESYTPPPPPPLPRPRGPLGLAWVGLLGSPLLLLILVLTGTYVPQLLSWALVGAFLGGFLYLVWHMPSGPRDPFDDGARI